MPIVCNLTAGLVLAAILIVPQYASAAASNIPRVKTELCGAKPDVTYIGPR